MLNSPFDYKVYTRQFERRISEQILSKVTVTQGIFPHPLFIYLFISPTIIIIIWKSPQTTTSPIGQLMYSFHVCVFIWQGMMACMFNKGENCIAAGRLFVEASIHDEFVHRVVSLSRMIGSVFLHYWGAATHVAQVQVLPEIRRVGCGLSLVLGVTLFCSKGLQRYCTLVYPSRQNQHSGK